MAAPLRQAASFQVMSAGELNRQIEQVALAGLEPVELRQILLEATDAQRGLLQLLFD